MTLSKVYFWNRPEALTKQGSVPPCLRLETLPRMEQPDMSLRRKRFSTTGLMHAVSFSPAVSSIANPRSLDLILSQAKNQQALYRQVKL